MPNILWGLAFAFALLNCYSFVYAFPQHSLSTDVYSPPPPIFWSTSHQEQWRGDRPRVAWLLTSDGDPSNHPDTLGKDVKRSLVERGKLHRPPVDFGLCAFIYEARAF